MKGAIPVKYIIALILGITVITIMGYWFFVLSGRFTATECDTKKTSFCQAWSLSSFTIKPSWDAMCGTEPSIAECKNMLNIECDAAGTPCTPAQYYRCCSNSCTEKFDDEGNSLGFSCD